jgi:hypothetical protein
VLDRCGASDVRLWTTSRNRTGQRQSTTNDSCCWLSFALWLVLLDASHCLSPFLSRAWRPCLTGWSLPCPLPWPLKGSRRLVVARLFLAAKQKQMIFGNELVLFCDMCGPSFSSGKLGRVWSWWTLIAKLLARRISRTRIHHSLVCIFALSFGASWAQCPRSTRWAGWLNT